MTKSESAKPMAGDKETFDVVVVGYGPTGMATASLLGSRGHRVAVFERWPTLYGQPRMATIDGESARIIQAAGDIKRALANSVPRPRYLIANQTGKILIDHDWNKEHVCGFPYRISLHQPDIEDAMDAAARARGVRVFQGYEVVSVTPNDEHVAVVAQARSPAGAAAPSEPERQVQARYVIAADGARSSLRTMLGIPCETWPFRAGWRTFDATRKRTLPNFYGVSPDGRVAVIFAAPEGRAHSIIPLGTGHIRFNFEVVPDTVGDGALHRDVAYSCLRNVYGITEDDVEVYREAVYTFEGRLAQRWRHGRVFLAGDAAHVMTPFQGQGGCSGLRDAINLSWKLDLVLKGLASDALLDTYEVERKPDARRYVHDSDALGAMIFLKDPDLAAQRDRELLGARATSANGPSGSLRDSAMSDSRPAEQVASLGPQGVVKNGATEGRFDDMFGWGFQVLGWNIDPNDYLGKTQREYLLSLGAVIKGITDDPDRTLPFDRDGHYREFFRAHDGAVLVVRPDFRLFGVARVPEELSNLVDDLRHQCMSVGANIPARSPT